MEAQITCLDCGGSMEVGYVPDLTGITMAQSSWISGVPVIGMFGGIADLTAYKRRLPIVTYRCASCGVLKSYARSSVKE